MRALVDVLCSEPCAGRAPGTPEGRAARGAIVEALRRASLDPAVQPVPRCNGANVLATIPGSGSDRWVLVAAHYDHLGRHGREVFWGADDNAAAVAVLVELGRALAARRPEGRGVVLAAFDGEEPPYFLSDAMGSQHFARNPTVPLDAIDLMVCMDLVGHGFGAGADLPDEVSRSLFALGAERSEGTLAHVESLARAVPGLVVRAADAEIIPPLSDYDPFWRRRVPFVFLTAGRSRRYHTPDDTPEHLDWAKIEATARWLERFVRETCSRPEPRLAFREHGRADAATLKNVIELTRALEPSSEEAAMGRLMAEDLLDACGRDGGLPRARRDELRMLVGALEARLA